MIKSGFLRAVLLFSFCLAAVLGDAKAVFCADANDNRSTQLEDKVTGAQQESAAGTQTISELIELLKQRAMLKVKKKKREQLFKVSIFSTVSGGYESNVNNDDTNKGDTFSSQFLMLNWKPAFNKWFGLNIKASSFNQIYSDFTDSNYLFSGISASAMYYPFSDGKLRLEPGIGYETLWYPLLTESNYNNTKYFLNTKHFFSAEWNADLNFEVSFKEYDAKKARNPSEVIQESVREDERYAVKTGISHTIGRYSFGLEGKAYRNTSNDLYQDLNDYYAFASSLSIAGTFLEDDQLYVVFTPNFERKNYRERQAVDTARCDDRYNYRLSAYYTLTKNYTLTYQFDYWNLDSNDAYAEYKNVINEIGVSVRF